MRVCSKGLADWLQSYLSDLALVSVSRSLLLGITESLLRPSQWEAIHLSGVCVIIIPTRVKTLLR